MNIRKILRVARWEIEHQYSGVNRKQALLFCAIILLSVGVVYFVGSGVVLQDRLYTVAVDDDSQYYDVVRNEPSLTVVDPNTLYGDEDVITGRFVESGRVDLEISQNDVFMSSEDRTSKTAFNILKNTAIEENKRRLVEEGYRDIALPVLAELTYMEQTSRAQGSIGENIEQRNLDDNSQDVESSDGANTDDSDNTNNLDSTRNTEDGTQEDTQRESPNQDAGSKSETTGEDSVNSQNDSQNNQEGNQDTNRDANQDSNQVDDQENNQGNTDTTNQQVNQRENDTQNDNREQDGTIPDGEGNDGLQPPGNIQPPFPLTSVILGFIMMMPMNFIVQGYASSVYDDRIDYSGELLLVTPVSRYDIIVGKTLPYMVMILLVSSVIGVTAGASILSVLAIASIGIAFLGSGFITGIFARSYRELTFVFLTLSLGLFGFVLIPAIFTTIHPIAIISPLTVVVSELENQILTTGDLLFSMLPLALTGIIMFIYGAGIYEEEDLFTQKRVFNKLMDSLSNFVHSWKSMLLIGASMIPFVFAVQLLFVAVLFAIPRQFSIPAILIFGAITEEVAKSLPVYAGVINDKIGDGREKYLAAMMSGIGFFVAEQVTTIVQLVGLLEVQIGGIVFGGTLAQISGGSVLGVLLPVLWIAIHPISTLVASVGVGRGKQMYILTVLLGALVHIAYNVLVIVNA